ncbi:MAG: hypothetical protein ACI80V_003565 [Rhodothermales bacterium]|jgi:hypothetical protein
MPAISMFYGIIVYMYFVDYRRHHLPHIHARYQNEEAVVSIPEGALLEGSLPRAKLKLLNAWVELHREELEANWTLAVSALPLFKIEPLR